MHFGFAAELRVRGSVAVYRSLKMLCAYPDRFYGDRAELPPGLNARDLATLYVAYLIGGELREDPTFLLVSYGLARRLADVPDIYRPSEVPNFKPELPELERPNSQDIYT